MSIDSLEDYAFLDPRVTLILAEWLSPDGLSARACELLVGRAGWPVQRVELLHAGIGAYWKRAGGLSARSGYLPAPRARNVAVVHAPDAVRPFCQMLNASTWTLYACDLDPDTSHFELVAYLLLQGDRLAPPQRQAERERRRAINFLNVVLGNTDSTFRLWRSLNGLCRTTYGCDCWHEDFSQLNLPYLLQALQTHLGLVLAPSAAARPCFSSTNSLPE